MDKKTIISKTADQAKWWALQRISKIKELSNGTMAINPFLIPLISGLQGTQEVDELVDFLIGGHLSVGHATGFGKLIDEKILPIVFGTSKLDKAYRKKNNYTSSIFDEIDHIVRNKDGVHFLSLKASKWTIQLTMAVQLNKAFCDIIELRKAKKIRFDKIVIGVFYGTNETLTDKYRIACGVCTGAKHDVKDVTKDVNVLAGKKFWAWLNDGKQETQSWVLEGLIAGTQRAISKHDAKKLVQKYKNQFHQELDRFKTKDGIDWQKFLESING